MRVLAVNKFYYRRGGAEAAMFAEMDLLRSAGHDVVPFAMQDPANEASRYGHEFVGNVEFGTSQGAGDRVRAAGRMLYSRDAARGIGRVVSAYRPHVAHAHNIYHQLSPSVLRELTRRRVPVVMTLHDYKLICPAYTLYANGAPCERCIGGAYYNAVLQGCVKGSRLKSALCATEAYAHHLLGLYERNVKYFIAPSHFMRRKVIESGLDPRRVVFVPNFVDTTGIPVVDAVDGHVLYAGRLERVKGVRTLIEAWGGIDAGSRELWIAGDGDDADVLRALARAHGARNVRFLGHLGPEAMSRAVAGAAFTVAPSEWYENAPMSVLEAAAHGKASIVTDMGGLPELVRDGESGVIVPPGDARTLGRAIAGLLADPTRARAMGLRARERVEREFSPARHERELMAVYEQAIGAAIPAVAEEKAGVAV